MANPPSLNLTQKGIPSYDQNRANDALEWAELMAILGSYAQTHEGKTNAIERQTLGNQMEIVDRWRQVDPLRALAKEGIHAPIGEIPLIRPLIKSAKLGQILDGIELRSFYQLLESTQKVYQFSREHSARAPILNRIRGHLIPLPQLQKKIAQCVGPDGHLLDDASEKLMSVRRQKVLIRRKIEDAIGKLLQDPDLSKYLQDNFWTLRNERYVVPIRLDGRGRIKGSIRDTSDSGQTLFIEPLVIVPINDQLLEMDLEEKLEIARIFRELSEQIAQEADPISGNYQVLVQLDQLTAEALLAVEIDAGIVETAESPQLHLIDARHPLIRKNSGRTAIGNSILLPEGQTCLIVSGPNAGGKTVVLKTVGIIQKMAQTGLLIPADPTSKIFIFDRLFVEMGDHQNLAHNLSTFTGHLLGLKPILASVTSKDLVLLDELAVGTDPETGAAFAAAFLEDLADRKVMTMVTTHFDALKGLALKDHRFRNGSMEFSLKTLMPTYRLILDVPGQSYGLEVAEQIGFPLHIIERAKTLKRGGHAADLNSAISDLMSARDQTRISQEFLDSERLKLEGERLRWEQEIAILKESRQKIAHQMREQYETQMNLLRKEFDDAIGSFRSLIKSSQDVENINSLREAKNAVDQSLKKMKNSVSQISSESESSTSVPGTPVEINTLKPGESVFVSPLKKPGVVLKVIDRETVEVNVGVLKMRLKPAELRRLSLGETPPHLRHLNPKSDAKVAPLPDGKRRSGASPLDDGKAPRFVIQTHLNTLDLRGMSADDAIKSSWSFIDRSLLRGEEYIIILHGHGEGILKNKIREALEVQCPYDISFRPGHEQEGGDGVTVVRLNR